MRAKNPFRATATKCRRKEPDDDVNEESDDSEPNELEAYKGRARMAKMDDQALKMARMKKKYEEECEAAIEAQVQARLKKKYEEECEVAIESHKKYMTEFEEYLSMPHGPARKRVLREMSSPY